MPATQDGDERPPSDNLSLSAMRVIAAARDVWQDTAPDLNWHPSFLHCGSYNDNLRAFPLIRNGNEHFLWIPHAWKFALRFINHVLYCVWYASQRAGPIQAWELLARMVKYTEKLRSKFFEEVLAYWYPSGTQLPATGRPKHRSCQLQSDYFATFLILMFNRDSPIPPIDDAVIWTQRWKLDHMTLVMCLATLIN